MNPLFSTSSPAASRVCVWIRDMVPITRQPQQQRTATKTRSRPPLSTRRRSLKLLLLYFATGAGAGVAWFHSVHQPQRKSSPIATVKVKKEGEQELPMRNRTKTPKEDHIKFMGQTGGLRHYRRILCYGDSLTFGSTTTFQKYPYGPYLQAQLPSTVDVQWLGLPGWTTAQMVAEEDRPGVGLQALLQDRDDGEDPIEVVILLAGTNDLWNSSVKDIFQRLIQLHQVCFNNHVSHTIAIGIPPSHYQANDAVAAQKAHTINQQLQAHCEEHADQTTYVEFPFDFRRDGKHWDPDGLHFSQRGYQEFGDAFSTIVQQILSSTH